MNEGSVNSKHWVLIPAAGIGSRMQADRPKQYLNLNGKTILEHTLGIFEEHKAFSKVYLGLANQDPYWAKLSPSIFNSPIVYEGGKERSDTVLRGLEALSENACDEDWVWVHDGARPCLSTKDIDLLLKEAELSGHDCLLLVAPIVDTVKASNDDMCVQQTIDRTTVWRAMTPQVCRYGLLKKALLHCQSHGLVVTDEASAVEALGTKPKLVVGESSNLKITKPEDLGLAEFLMKQKSMKKSLPRIGSGFDVHAFEPGDHLVLCGVNIPFRKQFKAHSDGDVALHALMDAILGALAKGDIGHHFPDTDEQWKGADSRQMLSEVVRQMTEMEYVLGNVDLTIIAQKPKLASHLETMKQNLAEDLGLEMDEINIKATTTEKLGFTGREEGIAAQASVLLVPNTSAI